MCASRWSFTKNHYMMHGQQNVKSRCGLYIRYWVTCRLPKCVWRNKKLGKYCDGLRDAGPVFGSRYRKAFFPSPPLQNRQWSAAKLIHKPTNKIPRNNEVNGSASCRLWRTSLVHTSCPEKSRWVLWDVAWQTCIHDSNSRQNWPEKHCIKRSDLTQKLSDKNL